MAFDSIRGDEGETLDALGGWKHGDGISVPVEWPAIDWLILGGESGNGPDIRPCSIEWIREPLLFARELAPYRPAVFVKQVGSRPVHKVEANGFVEFKTSGRPAVRNNRVRVQLPLDGIRNRAGADPAEWSPDLRVREYPPD